MTGERKPLSTEHRANLSLSASASMTPERREQIRQKQLEVSARPEVRAQRSAAMKAFHARSRAAIEALAVERDGDA